MQNFNIKMLYLNAKSLKTKKKLHGLFNVIKNTLNMISTDTKENFLVIKLILYFRNSILLYNCHIQQNK